MIFRKYKMWGDYHWRYYYQRRELQTAKNYNAHVDKFIEMVEPEDMRILDIGCGDGLMVHLLRSLGFYCTGIDDSEEGISLARAHGQPCEVGTIYDLGKYDKFDAVILSDVLAWLDEPEQGLAEVGKITDKIYVSAHLKDWHNNSKTWTPELFKEMFLAQGFKPKLFSVDEERIYAIFIKQ